MHDILTDVRWTCHGRHVEPGTELSVRGERGRFKFRHYSVSAAGEWIDVFGGPEGHEAFRSFAPERVVRVHRARKLRP